MDWECLEQEVVAITERELGGLVVHVGAKDIGSGQIMCQMELLTESGPLCRDGHPKGGTSFTRHFIYSHRKTALVRADKTSEAATPEQVAWWLFRTAFRNWEGRLAPSKWSELRHEEGMERRMTQAFLHDAQSLLDSGLSCCVALHLTDLSLNYHTRVSHQIGREKVLECWDRGIVLDVMDS